MARSTRSRWTRSRTGSPRRPLPRQMSRRSLALTVFQQGSSFSAAGNKFFSRKQLFIEFQELYWQRLHHCFYSGFRHRGHLSWPSPWREKQAPVLLQVVTSVGWSLARFRTPMTGAECVSPTSQHRPYPLSRSVTAKVKSRATAGELCIRWTQWSACA